MNIDRPHVLEELEALNVGLWRQHLRAFFDGLLETDSFFDAPPPGETPEAFVTNMMAFILRMPEEDLRPGARVLDIGSGQGRLLLALRRTFGIEAHGVDRSCYGGAGASAEALQAARTLWELHNRTGLRVLSPFDANRSPLPYPDGFFDIVTAQQGGGLLSDGPNDVLKEVLRVLKPGGTFVISEPNRGHWAYQLSVMRGEALPASSPDWRFTLEELQAVIDLAGFEMVRAETVHHTARKAMAEELRQYLTAIQSHLSQAYGIQTTLPDETAMEPLGEKMWRLGETSIISALKPASTLS